MSKANIIKLTEQYILSKYDYEPGDFTIPTVAPPTGNEPPGQPPANGTEKAKLAKSAGQRFTADQEDVEFLADAALTVSRSPMTAKRIREIISLSSSPEHLVELLTQEALDYDAEPFRELMERALFAADVLGYANSAQHRGV